MPTRRLRPFDRLPALDRELIAEWDDIVRRRTEISGGVFLLSFGSDARLAKLYARCRDERGWLVYASTADTVANSSAYQAITDGNFSLAVEVLERVRTHPRFDQLPIAEQDRHKSLLAASKLMAGDVSKAVELWEKLMVAPGKPMVIFHDVSAACEMLGKLKPETEVEPRLLPILAFLKSKSKKIQAIADGSLSATNAELGALFEAARVKMWERRQAKLGKPFRHAS